MTKIWIWTDNYEDDSFQAEYDFTSSSVDNLALSGPKRIPDHAHIVLYAKRYSKKRISTYGSLPFLGGARVVNKRVKSNFENLEHSGKVQLFQISVIAKDGLLERDFLAVVPLQVLDCLDREKSEITRWLVQDKAIAGYNSLVFHEDKFGSSEICRDAVSNYTIVSNELKLGLETTGERGFFFQKPEDTRSMW